MERRARVTLLAAAALAGVFAGGGTAAASDLEIGRLPAGWVARTNLDRDPRLVGGKNLWTIGSAALDPADDTKLVESPAGDQWVNTGNGGLDIHTVESYGDVHVEFEVMLPRRGNSGFYLCGEYEVQIWDSYGRDDLQANQKFGTLTATHDPYVRAEKAPGEWQKFVIDFRAPRFDKDGNKVKNAVFERVTLNGQLIHENIEAKAPTPVGLTGREAPEGPILIQGFVGQVAYRNVRIERRPAPVPALAYQPVEGFFKLPPGKNLGEASAVAVAEDGHVLVFNRGPDPIVEFDEAGRYVRGFGHGIASAHGMRLDRHGNIWVTDTGGHVVLRLDRDGRVTMVLGRRNRAGADEDLFDQPTDVAFGPNDEIFVTDGYGNSRVVKFDKDGNHLRTWGSAGNGPGQFKTPHTIAVDASRESVARYRPYVALIYVDVIEFDGRHIRKFYSDIARKFQAFMQHQSGALERKLRPGVSPLSAIMLASRFLLHYFAVELVFGVPNHFGKDTDSVLKDIAEILKHGMLPHPGQKTRALTR